ncbi:hypothetical protein [Epilithonimonas sp.]|uniref:hypothetical protein n=1 Tax=Epilithonimonas sp. TaxID=2894511 RepID=UPI0035B41CAE
MITPGWKFITAIPDGEPFYLDGINIWDFKWQNTNETIEVKDPLYQQDFVLDIYKINAVGKDIVFAAGEFSNCIWGIYQKN